MKTIMCVSVLAASLSLVGAGCHSRSRTERAAAVGAATGAVIGGVVGNQSGNPRTGAAIGAVAGGLAGGAYGSRQEQAVASNDSSDYYLSLMTADEVEVLRARARASGNSKYSLTDYLTEKERANLRHRDATQREIGR